MKNIELHGHVDEQHRLIVVVPTAVPPGPVKVVLELPAGIDDELSTAWAQAIAHAWAKDWDDPREDIYTLDDGEPSR